MLRYDLSQPGAADDLEAAVEAVLDKGFRTGDIMQPGCTLVVTSPVHTHPIHSPRHLKNNLRFFFIQPLAGVQADGGRGREGHRGKQIEYLLIYRLNNIPVFDKAIGL